MTIDPTRLNDIRARTAAEASELAESQKKPSGQKPGRKDQVEISDEARELARQTEADRVPLTEARTTEIQGRLEAGFYERPEIVREIAERILDSGEL